MHSGGTGTFSHGDNAREMELMAQAGIITGRGCAWDVYFSTVGGSETCGGDLSGRMFGWFEEGCHADIMAPESGPRTDVRALRKVSFVMKDARVLMKAG